jgi:hypothetical protein
MPFSGIQGIDENFNGIQGINSILAPGVSSHSISNWLWEGARKPASPGYHLNFP